MSWNEAQINEIFLTGQTSAIQEQNEGVLHRPVLADEIMEKWWNRGYESQWRLFRAILSDELKNTVENCNHWGDEGDEIFHRVHSAIIEMGTFQKPLNDNLNNLTLSEWQFEQTKRILNAVVKFINQPQT